MKVVFPSRLYKSFFYNVVKEDDRVREKKKCQRETDRSEERGQRKSGKSERMKKVLEARLGPRGTPSAKRFLLSLVLV